MCVCMCAGTCGVFLLMERIVVDGLFNPIKFNPTLQSIFHDDDYSIIQYNLSAGGFESTKSAWARHFFRFICSPFQFPFAFSNWFRFSTILSYTYLRLINYIIIFIFFFSILSFQLRVRFRNVTANSVLCSVFDQRRTIKHKSFIGSPSTAFVMLSSICAATPMCVTRSIICRNTQSSQLIVNFLPSPIVSSIDRLLPSFIHSSFVRIQNGQRHNCCTSIHQ